MWRRMQFFFYRLALFTKVVARSPNPVRRLAAHIIRRTGLWRLFTIQRNGYQLHFYPSALSLIFWSESGAREDDEDFFRELLNPGDIVIDVGANIGALAIVAANCVGHTGRVVAIEAHPRIYNYLVGNLALNDLGADRVDALHLAAGAEEGTVVFSDEHADDMNKVTTSGVGITVRMVRLDNISALTQYDRIALLKIDVEGYEYHVLRGARELLARTSCVYFEYNEAFYARFGATIDDTTKLLRQEGFALFSFVEGELVLIRDDFYDTHTVNLVAIRV